MCTNEVELSEEDLRQSLNNAIAFQRAAEAERDTARGQRDAAMADRDSALGERNNVNSERAALVVENRNVRREFQELRDKLAAEREAYDLLRAQLPTPEGGWPSTDDRRATWNFVSNAVARLKNGPEVPKGSWRGFTTNDLLSDLGRMRKYELQPYHDRIVLSAAIAWISAALEGQEEVQRGWKQRDETIAKQEKIIAEREAEIKLLKPWLPSAWEKRDEIKTLDRDPKLGQVWKHYKGGEYLITGFVQYEPTNVRCVCYRSLTEHKASDKVLWARPIDYFLGMLEDNSGWMIDTPHGRTFTHYRFWRLS